MGDVLWVFSYHMISVSARPFHEVGKVEFVGGEQPGDLRPSLAGGLLGDVARVGRPPCIEGVGRAYQNISWFPRFYRFVCTLCAGVLRGFCEGCRGFSGPAAQANFKVVILLRHVNSKVRGDVQADCIDQPRPRRDRNNPGVAKPFNRRAHLSRRAPNLTSNIRH